MIKTINSKTEDVEYATTNCAMIATQSKTTITITISEIHKTDKNIQKEMIQALIEALSETIK
jgi:hypothetical protein